MCHVMEVRIEINKKYQTKMIQLIDIRLYQCQINAVNLYNRQFHLWNATNGHWQQMQQLHRKQSAQPRLKRVLYVIAKLLAP